MAARRPKYLMLYSTRDGHTKTIMDTIVKQLTEETGVLCDVVDIKNGDSYKLGDYDKVLIGASIRYGHFSATFIDYVRQHHRELCAMPSAFFSVNLTARKPDKNTAATNVYTRKFLNQSPWSPQLVGVFAGALWYPRYNFFDRVFIQFIMRMTGGETDSTKEVVYTDWDAVRRFASDFAALSLTVPPPVKANACEKPNDVRRGGRGAIWLLAVVSLAAAAFVGSRVIDAKRG
ncbi:protoporphyrinogen oxidase-like protein [Leishmania tarentolae]|uniref:Protoporphyrinogen oxidase-like protein n=1 Tax=Leishmania tarentolae TaxID=5689 RepID=A0A640K8W6_LEITA|nr:protoporphyrinogen oxidase-like protein [Leishmania tarentolae]